MARILVVDDEAMIQRLISRFLSSYGHTTQQASNAEEALDLIDGPTHYDLAIVDLSLPGTPGEQLIESIRVSGADLPVMVMSGYIGGYSTGSQRRLERLGVKAIVSKPFEKDELLSTVTDVLHAAH